MLVNPFKPFQKYKRREYFLIRSVEATVIMRPNRNIIGKLSSEDRHYANR